jgi:hypothetical protein
MIRLARVGLALTLVLPITLAASRAAQSAPNASACGERVVLTDPPSVAAPVGLDESEVAELEDEALDMNSGLLGVDYRGATATAHVDGPFGKVLTATGRSLRAVRGCVTKADIRSVIAATRNLKLRGSETLGVSYDAESDRIVFRGTLDASIAFALVRPEANVSYVQLTMNGRLANRLPDTPSH